MKLLHKCLIFCLIVLSAQIGTFLVLAFEVFDSQKEVERLSYSNKVMSYVNEVVENLHEAMFCISSQVMTRSPEAGLRFKTIATRLPELVDELKDEKFATAADKADIEAISKSVKYVIDGLTIIEEEVIRQRNPGNLGQYFTLIKLDLKPQVADIMEISGKLSERHSVRRGDTTQLQARINELVKWMVLTGFGTSIVATIAVVIAFNREVAARIGIIADNFGRTASGAPLNPRQPGNDEIARLDHGFHRLTSALTQMMENERQLFKNMPIGLITFDQSGRIEALNPSAELMLGRSAGSLQGGRLSNILSEKNELSMDFAGHQAKTPIRVELKRADGSVFPAEIIASDYMNNNERKQVLSILDISAREEVSKLKEEFVSIVGHDIRAPLTSIDACFSLITDGAFGKLPEAGLKQVRIGREQCSRLFRLTSELLDMAKLDSGKMVVDTQECVVSDLIETAMRVVDHDAEKKKIEIVREDSDGLKVLADGDRTVQILQNYLSNAVKFSPEGRKIYILSSKDSEEVKIAVKDEGPGIDSAMIPELFQRFKQVRPEDRERGTGLGLAICKMMAECQGGTVGVETGEGKGSVFWVRLPSA